MTRDELLKKYNEGRRDFSGADLRNANLSNSYLRNAILSNANLSGADLSYADLSNANLYNAYFSGAKINDVVIKNIRVFSSLYKYQVWAIIADDDSEWVRMGCFFRKREDWENDFWNNDNEFPNDNSEGSNMRLSAFNFACKWIDERKHKMDNKMENKFRTPMIDTQNVISFTCPDDSLEPLLELFRKLRSLGQVGSSREVTIDWDGDGRDRLENISVNGMTLDDWEKEWKRLEGIRKVFDNNHSESQNECGEK